MASRRTAGDCWVGFDLGGTKMLAAVYDRRFKLLGMSRRKTKGERGPKTGLQRIIETMDEALASAGRERRHVRGIGVGAPGMLDLNRGVLLHGPNLGWRNVPIKERLEKVFSVPVIVANDVDAGTYGEYRFGAGGRARCVLGVFLGTGIGGGCVYEGHLLRGRVGSAMEIGHVTAQPNGPLCGCGRRGCLEAVCGRLALAGQAAQAAYRGDAPHLLTHAGTDVDRMRSSALAAAIRAGDAAIERLVRDSIQQLGRVLADVTHLLAPDVIVLGGGLVEEMGRLYLAEVRDALDRNVTDVFRGTFQVRTAELGDYATAMGAAALATEPA